MYFSESYYQFLNANVMGHDIFNEGPCPLLDIILHRPQTMHHPDSGRGGQYYHLFVLLLGMHAIAGEIRAIFGTSLLEFTK